MEQKNSLSTLILVVVLGVAIGVGIVSKKAKDPVLKELLVQQQHMIETQQKLAAQLGQPQQASDATALLKRMDVLEQRVKLLEGDGAEEVRQAPPPEDVNKQHVIDVAHSYVYGTKDAPVTIVEFADFQCPFCARFHPPIKEILLAYPQQVNYVVKNFPLAFHPQARPAAKAAFAAGEQGKYFEMVDLLLDNGRFLSEAKFEELAKTLGINVKKFKSDYADQDARWEQYIQADMDLGRTVDVRGTPTFYINGRKTFARDFGSFKQEIDRILSE